MSTLTIAYGKYKEHVLYSTPCGEYVESTHICTNACGELCECIAGKNFLQEIGVN